jgi:CHASE3 domain sensor protein
MLQLEDNRIKLIPQEIKEDKEKKVAIDKYISNIQPQNISDILQIINNNQQQQQGGVISNKIDYTQKYQKYKRKYLKLKRELNKLF